MLIRISLGLVVAAMLVPAYAAPAPAKAIQCVAPRSKTTYKVESRCLNMQMGEEVRTYRLYKSRTPTKLPMPLVLVLHGGGGSGSAMEELTRGQFNRTADKRNLLIVYPDGVGRSWNDGRSDLRAKAAQDNVDDVAYLRALVDKIAEQNPVDRKRIYATGISNGGLMSFRLACDSADFVAAVAPVAANLSVELASECRPSRVVPVMIVNGTDDPMMPWIGGDIKVLFSRRGEVLSAQESFEKFTRLGDCALPLTHNPRDNNKEDKTSLIRHIARECIGGTEMRLYEVLGGGHTWPGGTAYLGERLVGRVSRELDASSEIWSFFAKYSMK